MNRLKVVLLLVIFACWTNVPAYAQNFEWIRLKNEVLTLAEKGDYDNAIVVAKKALELAEKEVSPNNSYLVRSLNNLAGLYKHQEQYALAEQLYKRALAINVNALGPNHPDVASSLDKLGNVYYKQGQYGQAEPLYKRALAVREKALGPNDPAVRYSLDNLAELYRAQGQDALAEPLVKRSLAITAAFENSSALSHEKQGQYGEAEMSYKAALMAHEYAFGPDHPDLAPILSNLAGLYRKTGREKEAEELEKRAAAIRAIKR